MNNPNFKLTFTQLLMICIAVMFYVSLSDGIALCMPVPEAPDIAPDPLPVPQTGEPLPKFRLDPDHPFNSPIQPVDSTNTNTLYLTDILGIAALIVIGFYIYYYAIGETPLIDAPDKPSNIDDK